MNQVPTEVGLQAPEVCCRPCLQAQLLGQVGVDSQAVALPVALQPGGRGNPAIGKRPLDEDQLMSVLCRACRQQVTLLSQNEWQPETMRTEPCRQRRSSPPGIVATIWASMVWLKSKGTSPRRSSPMRPMEAHTWCCSVVMLWRQRRTLRRCSRSTGRTCEGKPEELRALRGSSKPHTRTCCCSLGRGASAASSCHQPFNARCGFSDKRRRGRSILFEL